MAENFEWHEVSDVERKKIEVEAKALLDSFSKKLDGVDLKEEPSIDREVFSRAEGSEALDIDRDIMFGNAPKTNGDFIVVEKGGWK